MDDEHHRLISRLFGHTAVLGGSMGSALGPGELRIVVGGVVCGRGPTLADVIREASKALAVVVRFRAAA